MKIGIGTAQFGLDYGVTNAQGQIPMQEAHTIISAGLERGFTCIDTSPAYGNAEAVLGNYQQLGQFDVITKTISIDEPDWNDDSVDAVIVAFLRSLDTMKIAQCYGLLIHNPKDLQKKNARRLTDRLQSLKDQKKVEKIGVSVYDEEHIDQAKSLFDFDLIQLPLNIFNQDLAVSGSLRTLKRDQVEIHARSVFLQGIALSSADNLPDNLAELKVPLAELTTCAEVQNTSCSELCLAYIKQTGMVDVAILGVHSTEHLHAIPTGDESRFERIDWSRFRVNDSMLTNPMNWAKRK
jgi:aryl-alcohol dehydrogenase-like predicted oxidoreductase